MLILRKYLNRFAAKVLLRGDASTILGASSAGLQIGRESLPWRSVHSVQVFRLNDFVGDYFCIRFETTDGRTIELPETSDNWRYVNNMVEIFLPGSSPYSDWSVRLFVAKPGEAILIYSMTADSKNGLS